MQKIAAASANETKELNEKKIIFEIFDVIFFFYLRSVVNCNFSENLLLNKPALNAHSLIVAFALSEYSAGTVRTKRTFSE